jgi:hypothetical protein
MTYHKPRPDPYSPETYLVRFDLSYDIGTNEYFMNVLHEAGNLRVGIPRHRARDLIKNFTTLIEKIDREYPERIEK